MNLVSTGSRRFTGSTALARRQGFSLIELMVTVAIIGVLAAIALPLYTDYVSTARDAALAQNIDGMKVFQEDFRLRTGTYASGTLDPANTVDSLSAGFDWRPSDSSDETKYVITVAGNTYTVVVTDESGHSISRTLP